MEVSKEFFAPRSIVVVGASADPSKYAYRPLENLLRTRYAGALYAVNPRQSEIEGVKCFPDVAALPTIPDLALMVVPAAKIPATLNQCGEAGIANCIIVSSGFTETGHADLQDELAAIAKRYSISLLGPNCVGMINFHDNVAATSSMIFRGEVPAAGRAAVVSQSGGFGISVLKACAHYGIGVSKYVSVGNEAVVTAADICRSLLSDPTVEVVGVYLEALRDTTAFLALGKAFGNSGKTLVVLKVGTSPLGKMAASSHTGALLGDSALARPLLEQSGATVADSLEDFIDILNLGSMAGWPRARNLSVLSVSGGFSVMAADAASHSGLEFAQLSQQTKQSLRTILPDLASVHQNPIDTTAIADGSVLLECGTTVLDDAQTNSLLFILGPEDTKRHAEAIMRVARHGVRSGKPVALAFRSILGVSETDASVRRALRDSGIALLENPARAIRAIAALSGRMAGNSAVKPSERPHAPDRGASVADPDELMALLTRFSVTVGETAPPRPRGRPLARSRRVRIPAGAQAGTGRGSAQDGVRGDRTRSEIRQGGSGGTRPDGCCHAERCTSGKAPGPAGDGQRRHRTAIRRRRGSRIWPHRNHWRRRRLRRAVS